MFEKSRMMWSASSRLIMLSSRIVIFICSFAPSPKLPIDFSRRPSITKLKKRWDRTFFSDFSGDNRSWDLTASAYALWNMGIDGLDDWCFSKSIHSEHWCQLNQKLFWYLRVRRWLVSNKCTGAPVIGLGWLTGHGKTLRASHGHVVPVKMSLLRTVNIRTSKAT